MLTSFPQVTHVSEVAEVENELALSGPRALTLSLCAVHTPPLKTFIVFLLCVMILNVCV